MQLVRCVAVALAPEFNEQSIEIAAGNTGGYDVAFIFNTRFDRSGNDFDLAPLTTYLEEHI